MKKNKKSKNIWIIDIDNTIAKSSTSCQKNDSICQKLKKMEVLSGTKSFIDELENTTIVFLTARNYFYYYLTYRWLKKNGFIKSFYQLVMVLDPHQKIQYLRIALNKYNVSYVDDLTYNNHNNDLICHDELISIVNSLPLTYYGKEYIKQINSE